VKPQLRLPHKLSHRLILLVLVPLTFEFAFFGAFAYLQFRTERFAEYAEKSRAISSDINAVNRIFYAAAIVILRPDVSSVSEIQGGMPRLVNLLKVRINNLSQMTADDREQHESVQRVVLLINTGLHMLNHSQNAVTVDEASLQAGWSQEPLKFVSRIIKELRNIEEKEEQLEAKYRDHWHRWKEFQSELLVGGLVASIVLTLVVTQLVYSWVIKRLSIIASNTKHLMDNAPLEARLKGEDEISLVDNSFHDMAERLADSQRKERAAEAMRRDFVSMMSHDLKTPLASQKFFLSTLADGEQPHEQVKEQASLLESDMDRLLNMINNLLDFEKMDSGKLRVSVRAVSFDHVLQRSIAATSGLYKAKQLSVVCNTTPDIFVKADEERLVQVIVNLLSNAAKFSPRGTTITISTKKLPEFWEIRVSDQGPGIDPRLASKVFDRFEQADTDRNPALTGSGLGLHICKSLIEAQGGTIGLALAPRGGTSVWIRLESASPAPSTEMPAAHS
jgi:signal transduction histidine kinase